MLHLRIRNPKGQRDRQTVATSGAALSSAASLLPPASTIASPFRLAALAVATSVDTHTHTHVCIYVYRRQATCRALFVSLFRSSLSLPFCCFVHSFTRFHPIFCAGLLTAAAVAVAARVAAGLGKQQHRAAAVVGFASGSDGGGDGGRAAATVGRRYLLTSLLPAALSYAPLWPRHSSYAPL